MNGLLLWKAILVIVVLILCCNDTETDTKYNKSGYEEDFCCEFHSCTPRSIFHTEVLPIRDFGERGIGFTTRKGER